MLDCIRTRTFAAAYLLCQDQWLMLKRSETHILFPNVWAPIGGHVEQCEINSPLDTVLRELREEAGLLPSDVTDLKLKYITMRQKGPELRQLYLFFGHTDQRAFRTCREGEFHLIPQDKVLLRPLGAVNKLTLEYHFAEGARRADTMVGVVHVADGLPTVTWSPLQDWGEEPM